MGAGTCVAVEEHDRIDEPANAWGVRRAFLVRSLRSDHYAGSLAGMSTLSLATNGWLHVDQHSSALAQRLPSIAVAVLYAETLQVDEILAPDTESDPALAERLRSLLASVRLGFSPLVATEAA